MLRYSLPPTKFTMSALHSKSSSGASSGPLPVDLPPVTPLNVPRRSTMPASARVPATPAFNAVTLGHSRGASSGMRRPGSLPISLDVGSGTRQIRPLPKIPPTPQSAPPTPRRQISSNSLRPLPCLPCVPELGISLSVTPASPLAPPTPVVQSSAHLSPPTSTLAPPRRFASLSLRLNTSPDALEPRVSPIPSPPSSPAIPEPPTPNTAQRKRMSKLRRHLGETVQLELFPDPGDKENDLGRKREADIYSKMVVSVKQLLDLGDSDDSDTTSEDEDDEDEYSLVLTHGQAHRAIPIKRQSRKWIREKGGHRWVEENYSNILRDLRAL
ncbi:hypothetical protein C8R43DRAFT_1005225 [Mycena crocata]|nr:hypothetical protein C8R43DRAFT_1005225 [Mycena crocata]